MTKCIVFSVSREGLMLDRSGDEGKAAGHSPRMWDLKFPELLLSNSLSCEKRWYETQFSPPNLVLNWVRHLSFFYFPERLQPITLTPCVYRSNNVPDPGAFNPESQNFIPLFNKNFMTLQITSQERIKAWSIKWGVQLMPKQGMTLYR